MLAGAAYNYSQPLIRQQVESFILFGHVFSSNLPKWILEAVLRRESLTESLELVATIFKNKDYNLTHDIDGI